MKKYLFVVPSLSKGGAERVVTVLAGELAEQGYDVTVLRYFTTEADYPISDRVRVLTLSDGDEKTYEAIGKIRRLKQMRRTILEIAPDFILPFLAHVNVQTYLACPRKYKKKICFTVRNKPDSVTGMVAKIHRYFIHHKNRTIVQNEAQKSYFKESARSHIFVMSNPVNDSYLLRQWNPAEGSFTVIAAGRLLEQKNFPMLIRAFCDFCKDKDDVRLQIFGDGALKESLQAQIDELRLQDRVTLMGRSDHLIDFYEKSHVFVLSSDFEGMPNALLEAMALGMPCISTDCPTGPSEMIENEKNGLLIPTGDPEKMKDALEYMYTHKEDAARMGKEAREFVGENYRSSAIAEKLVSILEN